MSKDNEYSRSLCQKRREAVRQREMQVEQKPRFNARKRWILPPAPQQAPPPPAVPFHARPTGPGGLGPVCCQRSRWSQHGDSHVFCPAAAGGISKKLHVAYTLWAEHHETCAHCRQYDWYMPGAPREVTRAEALSGDTVYTDKEGVTRHYRWAPDTKVLCYTGAVLFRQWQAQASAVWDKKARELLAEEEGI